MCVNEVFKLMSLSSQTLNTYHMYMGSTGIYSHTFCYGKKNDCPVCSSCVRTVTCSTAKTLGELVSDLTEEPLKLKAPSLATADATLYLRKPKSLEAATRPNLDKPCHLRGEQRGDRSGRCPGDVALTLRVARRTAGRERGPLLSAT